MHELEKIFWHSFAGVNQQTYPPYNIIKRGNDFTLEFGVAGFSRDELSIDYDGRSLELAGVKSNEPESKDVEYVHRALAKRNFKQTIAVRGQFDIGEVYLENGILTVEMKDKTERIRPLIQIREDLPRLKPT